jgi:hypothetical protein
VLDLLLPVLAFVVMAVALVAAPVIAFRVGRAIAERRANRRS